MWTGEDIWFTGRSLGTFLRVSVRRKVLKLSVANQLMIDRSPADIHWIRKFLGVVLFSEKSFAHQVLYLTIGCSRKNRVRCTLFSKIDSSIDAIVQLSVTL